MKETDIAWAAGLFEGEGSITIIENRVIAVIQMTDLDILERMHSLFGGYLYACKRRQSHHKDAWKWYLSDTKLALEFIRLIYPYLGKRRKARADEALTKGVDVRSIKKANLIEKVFTLRSQGMTQKAIGDQLGYDRTYINKILNS